MTEYDAGGGLPGVVKLIGGTLIGKDVFTRREGCVGVGVDTPQGEHQAFPLGGVYDA